VFKPIWGELAPGHRIRVYRSWLGLSTKQVAAKSGVSSSYLSKIENGRSSPSLRILERIAGALNAPISDLISDVSSPLSSDSAPQAAQGTSPTAKLRPSVVRKGERAVLRPPKSEIDYELLTPDLRRNLEFTWACHPPHSESPVFSHPGEESSLCLVGSVRVTIGNETFVLGEGDSISFDPSVPHSVTNDFDEEAILITAETPASFLA
jgi:transcriptional regulator with XRE-family HTH domain